MDAKKEDLILFWIAGTLTIGFILWMVINVGRSHQMYKEVKKDLNTGKLNLTLIERKGKIPIATGYWSGLEKHEMDSIVEKNLQICNCRLSNDSK